MPTINQQSIFGPAPPGQRKILLATNIAETSITIDDVTMVVDTGMHKLMTYDALNKLSQLIPTWYAPLTPTQLVEACFGAESNDGVSCSSVVCMHK
jgi:hypothetical protein